MSEIISPSDEVVHGAVRQEQGTATSDTVVGCKADTAPPPITNNEDGLDIPPFLQRTRLPNGGWEWTHPECHIRAYISVPSSASPVIPVTIVLPEDPLERLAAVAAMGRREPILSDEHQRRLAAKRVRAERSMKRVNKMLAKQKNGDYTGVHLTGREAEKFLRSLRTDPCVSISQAPCGDIPTSTSPPSTTQPQS